MVNYNQVVKEDYRRMAENAYKANPKSWPEEWDEIKANFLEEGKVKERITNKLEVFQSFYPVASVIISMVFAIVITVIFKKFWIGVVVFFGMLMVIVFIYFLYYQQLERIARDLKIARNEYYAKYGRKTIKELMVRYGYEDIIPPQPKLRHDAAEEINFEDLWGGGEEGVPEKSKKESATFYYHLVGDDNKTSGNPLSGDESLSDGGNNPEEEPVRENEAEAEKIPTLWRRREEPQPGISEKAEEPEEQAEVKESTEEPVDEDTKLTTEAADSTIDESACSDDGAEASGTPNDDVEKSEEGGGEIPVFNTLDEFIAYFRR